MKLHKIETGFFSYDGGALFGIVPKLAWKEHYQADEDNLCRLTMRSLLIQTKDKNIIVDTGIGIKHLDIMSDYGFYGIRPLKDALAEHNLTCTDITDVVLTHLHFEHCGGCTYIDQNFQLQLTFPNATHWVAEEQWKSMLNPNVREENSFFLADMMEVFKKEKLKWINEETNIAENIKLFIANGHTNGQIIVEINDGKDNYVFCGDMIPTSANVPLDWISAYDIDPIASITEKEKLLNRIAKNDSWLIFCHDEKTVCARIGKDKDFYLRMSKDL